MNACVCLTVYVNKIYTELTEGWDNSGNDLDIGQSATEQNYLESWVGTNNYLLQTYTLLNNV